MADNEPTGTTRPEAGPTPEEVAVKLLGEENPDQTQVSAPEGKTKGKDRPPLKQRIKDAVRARQPIDERLEVTDDDVKPLVVDVAGSAEPVLKDQPNKQPKPSGLGPKLTWQDGEVVKVDGHPVSSSDGEGNNIPRVEVDKPIKVDQRLETAETIVELQKALNVLGNESAQESTIPDSNAAKAKGIIEETLRRLKTQKTASDTGEPTQTNPEASKPPVAAKLLERVKGTSYELSHEALVAKTGLRELDAKISEAEEAGNTELAERLKSEYSIRLREKDNIEYSKQLAKDEESEAEALSLAKEKTIDLSEKVSLLHSLGKEPTDEDAKMLIDYLNGQEEVAKLDKSDKIELTQYQALVIKEYLIGQRAIAKKEGSTEEVERLSEQLKKIRGYERKLNNAEEKQDPSSPSTVPRMDLVFEVTPSKSKEPTVAPPKPLPNPPYTPGVPPVPGPPNPPEVPPVPEEVEAEQHLSDAIARWATARIARERILSGFKEADQIVENQEIDDANQNLQNAFEEYIRALILNQENTNPLTDEERRDINSEIRNLEEQEQQLTQKLNIFAEQALLDRQDRNANLRELTDEEFNAQRATLQLEKNEIADRLVELRARLTASENPNGSEEFEKNPNYINELMKIRQRVDEEMLRQRAEKRPHLAKFNDFLKKHPIPRMIAGLALTGIGITGTVTGLAPLAVLGFGGRTALGAYGGYNAVRGGGEFIGNRQVGKTEDKANIDEELGVQEKQTTTRRWSKRAGAVVATMLAGFGLGKVLNAVTDGPPTTDIPRPGVDQRYSSINNQELVSRIQGGDYLGDGPQRSEAIARLRGVIGEDLYNRLGTQQREALLLLKNPQIDQAPEYFRHLTAGHFG